MTPERVREATGAWIWYPDTATVVETASFLLVRFPEWSDGDLVVLRFTPPDPASTGSAVEEVLARARATDASELAWWVRLGDDPAVEEAVVARGGTRDEVVDVFAIDLSGGAPGIAVPDVELRWALDVATTRDSYRVGAEVFGGDVPPDDVLAADADLAAAQWRAGLGGTVVAYVDGEPAATGGLTVAGDVARLWGGAVLGGLRGRGLYRAVLAARLDRAVDSGCVLGLVKGRIDTSGPILRRAGFEVFGQERCYLLPL